MKTQKKRSYFDTKAGVARLEGQKLHPELVEGHGTSMNMQWDSSSHISWDEFVERWEQRFSENP